MRGRPAPIRSLEKKGEEKKGQSLLRCAQSVRRPCSPVVLQTSLRRHSSNRPCSRVQRVPTFHVPHESRPKRVGAKNFLKKYTYFHTYFGRVQIFCLPHFPLSRVYPFDAWPQAHSAPTRRAAEALDGDRVGHASPNNSRR